MDGGGARTLKHRNFIMNIPPTAHMLKMEESDPAKKVPYQNMR